MSVGNNIMRAQSVDNFCVLKNDISSNHPTVSFYLARLPHMNTSLVHVLKCDLCDFLTLNVPMLKDHISIHHPTSHGFWTYSCMQCSSMSTEKSLMQEHLEMYHTVHENPQNSLIQRFHENYAVERNPKTLPVITNGPIPNSSQLAVSTTNVENTQMDDQPSTTSSPLITDKENQSQPILNGEPHRNDGIPDVLKTNKSDSTPDQSGSINANLGSSISGSRRRKATTPGRIHQQSQTITTSTPLPSRIKNESEMTKPAHSADDQTCATIHHKAANKRLANNTVDICVNSPISLSPKRTCRTTVESVDLTGDVTISTSFPVTNMTAIPNPTWSTTKNMAVYQQSMNGHPLMGHLISLAGLEEQLANRTSGTMIGAGIPHLTVPNPTTSLTETHHPTHTPCSSTAWVFPNPQINSQTLNADGIPVGVQSTLLIPVPQQQITMTSDNNTNYQQLSAGMETSINTNESHAKHSSIVVNSNDLVEAFKSAGFMTLNNGLGTLTNPSDTQSTDQSASSNNGVMVNSNGSSSTKCTTSGNNTPYNVAATLLNQLLLAAAAASNPVILPNIMTSSSSTSSCLASSTSSDISMVKSSWSNSYEQALDMTVRAPISTEHLTNNDNINKPPRDDTQHHTATFETPTNLQTVIEALNAAIKQSQSSAIAHGPNVCAKPVDYDINTVTSRLSRSNAGQNLTPTKSSSPQPDVKMMAQNIPAPVVTPTASTTTQSIFLPFALPSAGEPIADGSVTRCVQLLNNPVNSTSYPANTQTQMISLSQLQAFMNALAGNTNVCSSGSTITTTSAVPTSTNGCTVMMAQPPAYNLQPTTSLSSTSMTFTIPSNIGSLNPQLFLSTPQLSMAALRDQEGGCSANAAASLLLPGVNSSNHIAAVAAAATGQGLVPNSTAVTSAAATTGITSNGMRNLTLNAQIKCAPPPQMMTGAAVSASSNGGALLGQPTMINLISQTNNRIETTVPYPANTCRILESRMCNNTTPIPPTATVLTSIIPHPTEAQAPITSTAPEQPRNGSSTAATPSRPSVIRLFDPRNGLQVRLADVMTATGCASNSYIANLTNPTSSSVNTAGCGVVTGSQTAINMTNLCRESTDKPIHFSTTNSETGQLKTVESDGDGLSPCTVDAPTEDGWDSGVDESTIVQANLQSIYAAGQKYSSTKNEQQTSGATPNRRGTSGGSRNSSVRRSVEVGMNSSGELGGRPHRQNFTTAQNRLLTAWYERHHVKPYPTTDDTKELAISSGLSYSQVKKWFANKRARSSNNTSLSKSLMASTDATSIQSTTPNHSATVAMVIAAAAAAAAANSATTAVTTGATTITNTSMEHETPVHALQPYVIDSCLFGACEMGQSAADPSTIHSQQSDDDIQEDDREHLHSVPIRVNSDDDDDVDNNEDCDENPLTVVSDQIDDEGDCVKNQQCSYTAEDTSSSPPTMHIPIISRIHSPITAAANLTDSCEDQSSSMEDCSPIKSSGTSQPDEMVIKLDQLELSRLHSQETSGLPVHAS